MMNNNLGTYRATWRENNKTLSKSIHYHYNYPIKIKIADENMTLVELILEILIIMICLEVEAFFRVKFVKSCKLR